MTVSTTTTRAEYAGNGVTIAFALPFQALDEGDLIVVLTVNDTDTPQTLGVDYSVSGLAQFPGANGVVTMTVAPPNGATLTITRSVALDQLVSLQNQGPFFPKTIERRFDRTVMAMQQVNADLARALRVPEGESVNRLPALADRANRFLGFDAAGHPVASAVSLNQTLEARLASADNGEGASLVNTEAGFDLQEYFDAATGALTLGGKSLSGAAVAANNGSEIDHGSYTPVVTPITNVTASTILTQAWKRVGAVVSIDGVFLIQPTATGVLSWGFSLPIVSNLLSFNHAGGVASSLDFDGSYGAFADAASDRVHFRGNCTNTANQFIGFSFSYRII